MRKKVSIIGAGNVGATTAQRLYETGLTDIVLVDVVEGIPQGKALDILESAPVLGIDSSIIGTNTYGQTRDSDIVVITAGIARKPGMSRNDLISTNMRIVQDVTRKSVANSPNAVIIVVSNPLDAMVHCAFEASSFPRERVIGMAGVLDTARLRTFIAQELNVSVTNISTYVLGGHGDLMVPAIGATSVGGAPLSELMDKDKLDKIIQRTRNGGAEIVSYLKTGSAYYAPSAAITQMVLSILLDQNMILPCSVLLKGEYGYSGVFTGVPVKLGHGGLKEVIEIYLSETEKNEFNSSVNEVIQLVQQVRNLNF